MLDLAFEARFDTVEVVIGAAAYELEIFRDVLHLLALQVGHNNIHIVGAMIMHAAEKHKLRELRSALVERLERRCTAGADHGEHNRHHR